MRGPLPALLLAALGLAACGGGSGSRADADVELPADVPAEVDPYTTCEAGPAVGVLADRVPEGGWRDLAWEDPYPGGWTTVDATTRGVRPGTGDVSGPLQELIDSLAGPTILELPAGTYELHAPIEMAGDLILRGAGPSATRLDLVGINQAFTWQGVGGEWSWGWIDAEFQPRPITADVAEGGTTIPLADTTGLAAGDIVMVAESLDNPSFPSARLGKGGVFALAAAAADSVTVDLPLTLGLRTVNEAGEPTVVAKLDPIRNGGVENLAIVSPTLTGYNGGVFDFYLADNIFLRNVISANSFGADVRIADSRRILVTACFFDRTQGNPPDGGESIWIDALDTRIVIVDNILREKQPPLVAQVGGNFVVYAYNFHVDRIADYCHANDDERCREPDWIRDPAANGIARGWHGLADVVFHGNFPHHFLIEGNVFYNAVFDYHHFENGPGTTLFRNRILGNPWNLTWWMNGYAIWLDGPHDGQNLVGNLLLHDSIITYQLHNGPREPADMFVAGNALSGAVAWGDLPADTPLPPSLFRSCPPSFWPVGLPWPPFGPDVPASATNRIPAQLRYEALTGAGP